MTGAQILAKVDTLPEKVIRELARNVVTTYYQIDEGRLDDEVDPDDELNGGDLIQNLAFDLELAGLFPLPGDEQSEEHDA